MSARNTAFFMIPVLVVLAGGCAHRQVNAALESQDLRGGHRFDPAPPKDGNSNELFVVLTFSGGGTRAAALSYGVLEALRDTWIRRPHDGVRVRLLDEVDVISSVSGGSFTATYYGLFRDRIFEDFHERVLDRDIESHLSRSLVNPVNWFRMASGRFDRIDLAAEIYDDVIYDRRTFADLRRNGLRPFIVVNAANMTTGLQFCFTQDYFDFLGSDLDRYPIANAVAASSAVPVLFSPITLRNHPAPLGFTMPAWIRDALDNDDRTVHRLAHGLALYHEDKANHPYVHLLDGGVADNTGLRIVIESYRWGFIRRLMESAAEGERPGAGPIRTLLVIVVNAMNQPIENLDLEAASPGALDTALRSINSSIDNYTVETVQQLEDLFAAGRREVERQPPAVGSPRRRFHLVEVAFENTLDPRRRERLLTIPTRLTLEAEEVRDVVQAGRDLLAAHPEFQRFLRELPSAAGSPGR